MFIDHTPHESVGIYVFIFHAYVSCAWSLDADESSSVKGGMKCDRRKRK